MLIYCLIHFLTHRPLINSPELETLTKDYPDLRSFLTSNQADYREKLQRNVLEYVVSNASLNIELLNTFELFFLGLVNEFDH